MQKGHILHVFHGFRVGGSETRTCQIINALGNQYRHTVVSLNGDFSAQSLLLDPSNVTLLTPPGFMKRPYLLNAMAARQVIKRLRPDLMIAYSWGGFEWLVGNSLSKVCPDIFAIEGFDSDEADGESPRRRFLRRMFSNRCTALLACSLNLSSIALESWKVKKERIAYVPNGIDLEKYRPRTTAAERPRVVLGIVASLLPVKNHLLLLDGFRRLPDDVAELRIIGDGPERDRIARYVADFGLGSTVSLLGHQRDPSELVRQFDVFCLASRSEQMPMVVLEAMASGLPVVGTDVGDVKHMVCESNRRFVVPTNNADAYATALLELIGNRGLRRKIGDENRQRCQAEFGFSLMLQRHRDLYNRCVGARIVDGTGRSVVTK